MKTKNIILSSKNDSSISDRQVRDCPDVNEKTVPQRIPRRYRNDIKRLQERYDLHEGLVINVSLKEFRGICERDYPKIEAYLGLRCDVLTHPTTGPLYGFNPHTYMRCDVDEYIFSR